MQDFRQLVSDSGLCWAHEAVMNSYRKTKDPKRAAMWLKRAQEYWTEIQLRAGCLNLSGV